MLLISHVTVDFKHLYFAIFQAKRPAQIIYCFLFLQIINMISVFLHLDIVKYFDSEVTNECETLQERDKNKSNFMIYHTWSDD